MDCFTRPPCLLMMSFMASSCNCSWNMILNPVSGYMHRLGYICSVQPVLRKVPRSTHHNLNQGKCMPSVTHPLPLYSHSGEGCDPPTLMEGIVLWGLTWYKPPPLNFLGVWIMTFKISGFVTNVGPVVWLSILPKTPKVFLGGPCATYNTL